MASLATKGGQQKPDRSGVDSPSTQEVFDALSNQRRRYTLHYLLQEHDAPVDVGDVAEQVAAWENQKSIEAVSYAERHTVHTSLKQSHLPTLDDASLIKYDHERGEVTAITNADRFDIYLDIVERGTSIPWSEFYLGLSGTVLALTGLRAVQFPPFGHVPWSVWAGIVSLAFLVTAIAHYRYNENRKLGTPGPPLELREYTAEMESDEPGMEDT